MIYAKPKSYKPAVKKGYSAGAPVSSTFSGALSNPKTGTGSEIVSATGESIGKVGYASAGVTVIQGKKQGGTVLVSGSGNYKGLPGESGQKDGATVTAQSQSSYENVTREREASLKQAVTQGQKLSISQQAQIKAMQEQQRVNINIDKEAVNQVNKNFAAAGINNAGDFIKRARAGEVKTDNQGNLYVSTTKTENYTLGESENKDFFTAPRSRTGSESLYLNPPNDFPGITTDAKRRTESGTLGGNIDYSGKTELTGYDLKEGGLYQAFGDKIIKGIKQEVKNQQGTPFEIINPIREKIAVTAVNFGVGGAKGAEGLTRAYIIDPIKEGGADVLKTGFLFTSRLFNDLRPDNFIAGLQQTSSKVTSDVITGDTESAAQEIGGFYTSAKAFQAALNPLGSATKSVITNLRLKRELAGPEAPFYTNSFTIEGRQGVLTTDKTGALNIRTDKELQTQLKAKKIYDEQSLFTPEKYQPMKFSDYAKELEAGRINYATFAELTGIQGQKTFIDIEKARTVTPEEVINIFEAERLRGLEEQKKLATKTESGENVNLYSLDPLSASIASFKLIYEERNNIFSRQNNKADTITPVKDLNIGSTETKSRGGLFDNVYLTSTTPTVDIYSTSISRSDILGELKTVTENKINTKIDYKIQNKQAVDQAQDLSYGLKQGQRQAQGSAQAQDIAQAQAITTVTSQTQASVFKSVFRPLEYKTPPRPPETPKPFKSRLPERLTGPSSGFDVYARKRGKLQKVNYSSLTRSQAVAFGSIYVETTPAASFKIQPNKQRPEETNFSARLKNLYSGRGGLFIEKRSARINTFGELQGITYKGIGASKASRKVKNIFGA